MKVKEKSEKAGLKLNIQKTKMVASNLITSWQTDGETMETVTDYFLGLQITADGDCSHEIKRRLLLVRKVMTHLDSILKSRDITLPAKVRIVKAIFFFSLKLGIAVQFGQLNMGRTEMYSYSGVLRVTAPFCPSATVTNNINEMGG